MNRLIEGKIRRLEVNYDLSFEDMLKEAYIPKRQIDEIFRRLGGENIIFPGRKGKVKFEFANVHFLNNISIPVAAQRIREHGKPPRWEPIGVEHQLVYAINYPTEYRHNLVLAVSKTYISTVGSGSRIFCLGSERGHIDFELMHFHAADEFRSTTFFPQCREVQEET
jgi:hypothetical protein